MILITLLLHFLQQFSMYNTSLFTVLMVWFGFLKKAWCGILLSLFLVTFRAC